MIPKLGFGYVKMGLFTCLEKNISGLLDLSFFGSIKTRIIVFAILTTLVPSMTVGWLYYVYTKQFLQGKITEEMKSITSYAAQEINVWSKQCFDDIRVFSDSSEVSDNLKKILEAQGGPEQKRATARLTDYLRLVNDRVPDYSELIILDTKGQLRVTSADNTTTMRLPEDWDRREIKDDAIASVIYLNGLTERPVLIIAVPIEDGKGQALGLLGATSNLQEIAKILKASSFQRGGELYLVAKDGNLIASSQTLTSPFPETRLEVQTAQTLFESQGVGFEFTDFQDRQVIGVLEGLQLLDWGLVAVVEKKVAHAPIARLKTLTLLMVSGLVLAMGLIAYLLGISIVRPLSRLTEAAAEVSEGNLECDLPAASRDEIGHMTEVFNKMVVNLREGQEELASANKALREKNEELEEISITDSLTGLHNRRHLMEMLSYELARAQRYDHPLSILMIDIDHFKRYNDTLGHLAGDCALIKIASVFVESVRKVDHVARYGGEEFVIALPETGLQEATSVAERIRARVAETAFDNDGQGEALTVCIGVSETYDREDTPESMIARADRALYQAKRLGRNRVVCFQPQEEKKGTETPQVVH
jgi:diguanylate cyclase (GGDEF)-like protein